MHTLFFNEHNRIATLIYNKHKHTTTTTASTSSTTTWNDEKIFQETRKIVIGEFQNVVYNEYLPVILGNQFIDDFMNQELKLPDETSGQPPSTYDTKVLNVEIILKYSNNTSFI